MDVVSYTPLNVSFRSAVVEAGGSPSFEAWVFKILKRVQIYFHNVKYIFITHNLVRKI